MKFKIIVFIAFFVLLVFVSDASAKANKPPIKITIAINEANSPNFYYRIAGVNSLSFNVVIENISSKPVKLWRDWNSWGYNNLAFERIAKNGKTVKIEKIPAEFTKNFPAEIVIGPGELIVRKVEVQKLPNNKRSTISTWHGFPVPLKGKKSEPFKMRAVYSISETPEGKSIGVWTGMVCSRWDKFYIECW